mmetsp:Transcript_65390/g.173336  ORF Transcript_65390/g.173336 Transcript_65390/m.173336 type:complete len:200 (-) Transcript_65390:39-638(-)
MQALVCVRRTLSGFCPGGIVFLWVREALQVVQADLRSIVNVPLPVRHALHQGRVGEFQLPHVGIVAPVVNSGEIGPGLAWMFSTILRGEAKIGGVLHGVKILTEFLECILRTGPCDAHGIGVIKDEHGQTKFFRAKRFEQELLCGLGRSLARLRNGGQQLTLVAGDSGRRHGPLSLTHSWHSQCQTAKQLRHGCWTWTR